jgi:hypothetical protein
MTETVNLTRRGRSKWLVTLALMALAILALTAYRIASGSGVKQALTTLRDRGLPTSPAELDRWYTYVPGKENAALAFMEAAQLYVAPRKTNDPNELKVEIVPGEPLPPPLLSAVEQLLAQNREAIARAHEAGSLTNSRYSVDLTRGFATLLPHLAMLKRLSQLLKWEAIHQSTRGDKTAAVHAIKTSFALARSLENEPILISELVRVAIVQITLPALERVVSEQTLTTAELKELAEILERTEMAGKRSLQRALAGERAIAIPVFKSNFKTFEAISGGSGGLSDEFPDYVKLSLFELRRSLGINDRDLSFFLQSMGELENAAQSDYRGMLRDTKAVDNKVMREMGESRFRYLISGMLLPSLFSASRKEALCSAELRCARFALAIESYRLENGKQPSANDLVPKYLPEALMDPVDESPLEYEQLSKGYRVNAWAATDLKEDGKKNKSELKDISFTVAK